MPFDFNEATRLGLLGAQDIAANRGEDFGALLSRAAENLDHWRTQDTAQLWADAPPEA